MSILYRPVLIESAEQAEALPEEAIIIDDCGDRYTRPSGSGALWGLADGGIRLDVALAIGNEITALVPIEAEEEVVEKRRLCQKTPDVLRRYVTEWQHYTSQEPPHE